MTVELLEDLPPTEPVYRVPRRSAARRRRKSANGTFTREELVAKIQEWNARFGTPPRRIDWEPHKIAGRTAEEARWRSGSWPTTRMVEREFTRFGDAVRAAGLQPARVARRPRPQLASDDVILDAIRAWTKRYGEPPTQADWDSARARRLRQFWRVARYEAGDWPSLRSVQSHFGSLRRAIELAGLVPRSVGQHSRPAAQARSGNVDRLVAAEAQNAKDAGPPRLARAIREVATASRAADPEALRIALIELSGVAARWAADLQGS